MKKILLIFGIAIILLSCTKEEDVCKCEGRFTLDGNGSFYINNVKIDCETRQPLPNQGIQSNAFWQGCR